MKVLPEVNDRALVVQSSDASLENSINCSFNIISGFLVACNIVREWSNKSFLLSPLVPCKLYFPHILFLFKNKRRRHSSQNYQCHIAQTSILLLVKRELLLIFDNGGVNLLCPLCWLRPAKLLLLVDPMFCPLIAIMNKDNAKFRRNLTKPYQYQRSVRCCTRGQP